MTIQTFTAGQTLTAAQMNTLQASDFNFTRNVLAGTSYTMVLADKGKLLEFENTGSITLTIPTNATAAFDIGDRVDVLLASTGTLSIIGDTGVTLNAEGDLTTISSQWTRVTLIKRGTNSWVLTGGSSEVQTAEIEDGAVTEAKLASSAVTESKIASGAVTEAKLASGAVTSAKIADGTIVNADVNASAAIELSKLASGTSAQVVLANSSGVPTYTTVSGDISITNTGVVTIAANAVQLGNDTTGNYVASLVAGTGITLTNNSGEGATPTIAVTSNTYQPLDAELTAIAGITSAADVLPYFTGSGTAAGAALTSAARSILDDASTGDIRTTLGVGTSDSPTFAGATLDLVQVGVTAAGEIDTASGNLTIDSAGGTTTLDDNVIITGTLTVSGSVTTVNTQELHVSDNIIVVNHDVTGSPTDDGGIEVERGTSTNVLLKWNETTDLWTLTNDGSTYGNIVTTSSSTVAATSANTANAVVARDSSGNFIAGTATLTSASVSGRIDATTFREAVIDSSISTNVLTADYATGDIFYQATAPSANFTLNLTNAPTDNGKAINVAVFVTQGATGYYPSAVQVAGVGQTIKWANGAAPTPTSSSGKIDIFTFTFIRRGSAWTVFGSSNLGY